MDPHKYLDLKQAIIEKGYESDIIWAENVKKCDNSEDFVLQFIFVVCNSGMKAQIAIKIYERILQAICEDKDISEAFGHKGKVSAIKEVIENQRKIFHDYFLSDNKVEFCKSLPWIGDITKYHLAKNLGIDCVKPDRHLVRIANTYNTTPLEMCQKLSEITGDKLNTVDTIIWRAANLGLI
jgi:nickel-dependent lactate racemase